MAKSDDSGTVGSDAPIETSDKSVPEKGGLLAIATPSSIDWALAHRYYNSSTCWLVSNGLCIRCRYGRVVGEEVERHLAGQTHASKMISQGKIRKL